LSKDDLPDLEGPITKKLISFLSFILWELIFLLELFYW